MWKMALPSGACGRGSSGVMVASLLVALGVAPAARADEPLAPVFEGHPWLSTYTKEVSVDGAVTRLGDGQWVLMGGSSMAAFYRPWFSIQGAAQAAPGLGGTRQTYDTRALLRFIWPEPVLSRLFFYGGVGGTILFAEDRGGSEDVFRRGAGPVLAAGVWGQLTDRLRLRAEVRDHWLLLGDVDLSHNIVFGLSLATTYR